MERSGPRLTSDKGAVFTLGEGVTTIGRPDRDSGWSPTVDLTPLDPNRKASRRHAEIRRSGKTFFLKDLGAANRTFLNGQPLQPNTDYPLNEGDTVAFGEAVVHVAGIAAEAAGLRCPKCAEPVTDDMAICASCGANLTGATMTIHIGSARACFRCGRPTRGDEHCADCTAALAEADQELLALAGLKRRK